MKVINDSALSYIWTKLKNYFVHDTSYVHTDTNFTSTLKDKLDSIASGAEVNQNAFSNVKVGSSTIESDGKTDTLELVAGDNVTLTPDTTNDKVTIATSGEVNQNAFSNVKVGASTIQADSKTDTLELVAGDNITLTPDTTNDKVTISASGGGGTPTFVRLTYSFTNSTSSRYVTKTWPLSDLISYGITAPKVYDNKVIILAANLHNKETSTDNRIIVPNGSYYKTSDTKIYPHVQFYEDDEESLQLRATFQAWGYSKVYVSVLLAVFD